MNIKKIIITLVSIIIIVAALFMSIKLYNLNNYNLPINDQNTFDSLTDKLKMKTTTNITRKDITKYLSVNGLNIQNDFDSFRLLAANPSQQLKKYEKILDNQEKAVISFSIDQTIIDLLPSQVSNDNKHISSDFVKDFLTKNGLNDDIKLIKYLSSKNYQPNIFSYNSYSLQTNYLVNYLVNYLANYLTNSGESVEFLEGDLYGYIFNQNDSKDVYILQNNQRYKIEFTNKTYFTDEYILELLESITIE